MPEMVAPRALIFRLLVKGNEDSMNEIATLQMKGHVLYRAHAHLKVPG